MSEEFLSRQYPGELPLTDEEKAEFRRFLRENPKMRKAYKDFKSTELQELRSRLGRSPWLDESLDKLFELAAISDL